ncbi:MAG: hypothetical protein ACYTFY_10595 [Planctomycetota bacterium]|jgi:hypothetical protein
MDEMRFPEKCRIVEVPVPPMPGPFVNGPLMSVGNDKNGSERFWASTFNSVSGALGILVNEKGEDKRYDFDSSIDCAYSAVIEDDNTIWLCGSLDKVVRLNLKNGSYESFVTGLLPHLVFSGMVYDENTGKLFACAVNNTKPAGFSLNTRSKKARHFINEWKGRYIRQSFPNGDGTWSIMLHYPQQLIRWDPETDSITSSQLDFSKVKEEYTYKFIHDSRQLYYIPEMGWYDAVEDCIVETVLSPEREMLWFGLSSGRILGCQGDKENLQISDWNLESGKVTNLFSISETQPSSCMLTGRGDIAAMSVCGEFNIYDIAESALKLTVQTASESVCHVNNLELIDKEKLIGTTFINKRFFLGDIPAGISTDCGRAGPDSGQITEIHKNTGKIYMTSYHGGELVEFDQNKAVCYPMNPRPVTGHPEAMRPVAITSNRSVIWYACSRHYGIHGSVLFRYDTETGQSSWVVNPLGPRCITSIIYSCHTGELICGSTVNADMGSADRKVHNAVICRLNPESLAVIEMKKTAGINIGILGMFDKRSLLCAEHTDASFCFKVLDTATLTELDTELPDIVISSNIHPAKIIYAGKPGEFFIAGEDSLEFHDLKCRESLMKILVENFKEDTWRISDGHLLLLENDKVKIIYDIVKNADSVAI